MRSLDKWPENENSKLEESHEQVASPFSRRTNQVVQEIPDISSGLLELSLERFRAGETIDSDTSLYYMGGDPPKFLDLEGAIELLSGFPFPKNHKIVLQDLKGKLPELIDRDCRKMRAGFEQRVIDSHFHFHWGLVSK